MSWTEWLANLHGFFVHIPTAMAVFLPLPLIASQRVGRGIRPWWLVCRYLAVMGFIGLILTLVSGYLSVPGSAPLKSLLTASGRAGSAVPLIRHQISSTVSLVLGVLALLCLFRKRKDHESLGFLALFFGILWSAAILVTHHQGALIAGGVKESPKKAAPAPAAVALPAPVPVPRKDDPEAAFLLKILDFHSLSPVHAEPVRSKSHGDRWIRVWVSPEAMESYRNGGPLPTGALVVMNTFEDRWGRPSNKPGPLYAMEMRQNGPARAFYWGKIPEDQRANFGGADRVFWKDSAPQLTSCTSCHANGLAPAAQRSRWVAHRSVPKPDASDN